MLCQSAGGSDFVMKKLTSGRQYFRRQCTYIAEGNLVYRPDGQTR